jgi:hypothetical protein
MQRSQRLTWTFTRHFSVSSVRSVVSVTALLPYFECFWIALRISSIARSISSSVR